MRLVQLAYHHGRSEGVSKGRSEDQKIIDSTQRGSGEERCLHGYSTVIPTTLQQPCYCNKWRAIMAKYVALRNRYRYKQLSSTEEEKKEKKTKMGSPKLPSCIISVCEPVCVCVCVLVDGVRNPKSIYYYHRMFSPPLPVFLLTRWYRSW